VVAANGRVLDVIDPPAVLRWRRAGKSRKATLGSLLSGNETVVAYPDEYLDAVFERMSRANVAHVPVVSREHRTLAGYLEWQDLLRVRTRLQAEERERVALYRVR